MAVDPARRREQNRINKQNQRIRDAARAEGRAIPKAVKNYPATQAVHRAYDQARRGEQARVEALRKLPSARNFEHPERGFKVDSFDWGSAVAKTTRSGPRRQAAAIKENAAAAKLEAVGRGRRNQLRIEAYDSEQAGQYADYMSPEQLSRFNKLNERISNISLQALGILFNHEHADSTYNTAIDRLTGSPQSIDVEEGLAILEGLAKVAERADTLYSPRALKARGFGNNGRLGV